MLVTNISQYSGKTQTMELDITEEQITKYATGRFHIQDVFSNLTADEREFIKTGITPDEWEELFG